MAEGSREPHGLFAVTLLGRDHWWCVNNSLLQAKQTGGCQSLPASPPPTACSTFKARAAKPPAHRLARPWAGNGTEPPVLTAPPRGTHTSCPVSWKPGGCRGGATPSKQPGEPGGEDPFLASGNRREPCSREANSGHCLSTGSTFPAPPALALWFSFDFDVCLVLEGPWREEVF